MNVLVNEGRRWFLISVAESDSAPSLSRTSAERGGGAEEKMTSNPLFIAVPLLHLKGGSVISRFQQREENEILDWHAHRCCD